MTKLILSFVVSIICVACSTMPAPENCVSLLPVEEKLWPTKITNYQEAAIEKVLPDRGDNVRRITNIKEPSLTVYRANKNEATPAILVFPGGGYSILAINKEGTEIAEWLNGIGITAIVVKYRVPGSRTDAFQDAQRALRFVRHHAKEWNIDPKRIGVMGFSAGGHLAARLSTDFGNRINKKQDDIDDQDCRPEFCILIYPAYLLNKKTKQLAAELPVKTNTPPTFIVQTDDDKSFIDGTIVYDKALRENGVSSVFHRFPTGGHGYGLRPSKYQVSNWPKLCEKWLKANSIIPDTNKTMPRTK